MTLVTSAVGRRRVYASTVSQIAGTNRCVPLPVRALIFSVGAYLMKQMQAGRLRMVHPILALQSFIGPIFFHLMTRPMAERLLGLNMEGEAAVTALAEGWLRSMRPD